MIDQAQADAVVARLQDAPERGSSFRRRVVEELSRLPGYSATFIYLLEGDTLVLEHFVGEPTEHVRIPVGVGVCGTAVQEGRNQLVEDVTKLDNYLCCSLKTRSEVVVLIRRGGEILGQIDVDGHERGAFDPSDEEFLERVAAMIAERW